MRCFVMVPKRERIVSVVGGGWSFRKVDHSKVPGIVIAINDAGMLLRRKVDFIVTMDRLWTEHRWTRLDALRVPFYARRSALQNIKDWSSQDWVHRFENTDEPISEHENPFSDEVGTLNGNNSGVCGINLAYILRPDLLYLFGFDMSRDADGHPYWYPPYPWVRQHGNTKGGTKPARYTEWARQFNAIALQFAAVGTTVINVSDVSKINSFRRMTPQEAGMAK